MRRYLRLSSLTYFRLARNRVQDVSLTHQMHTLNPIVMPFRTLHQSSGNQVFDLKLHLHPFPPMRSLQNTLCAPTNPIIPLVPQLEHTYPPRAFKFRPNCALLRNDNSWRSAHIKIIIDPLCFHGRITGPWVAQARQASTRHTRALDTSTTRHYH